MTALALAGAGGGGMRSPDGPGEDLVAGTTRGLTVAPDLVLPPGFDRLGEVVRFEQDVSSPAASALSPAPSAVIHLAPAEGAMEPAPSTMWGAEGGGENGLRPPARAVDPREPQGATPSPGTLGLPGAVALPKRRGPYRCKACGELGHTQPNFCKDRRAARAPAPAAPRACALCGEPGHNTRSCDLALPIADRTACTRCGLRGHVAGDPDRCLFYRGGFGLGGQARVAQDQAQWQNRKGSN